MWSEDGDMEIGNDIEGGNAYSLKRKKKTAHGEAGGEAPGTYEEQDKNATVQDGIRDKNPKEFICGTERGGSVEFTTNDVANKGGIGCTHIKT
jgi:hypothetical protein